ncbi:MAG: TlpA family protein disulfide reductase [Taibaiella sp.]|nr:TlpA family protein disulfide reductase [Taibaiella sp.]
MKKVLFLLFLLASFGSHAQSIPAYSAEMLMKRASNDDTIYVINFWATWCAPCVHELPEFNKLYDHFAGKPVKILMVSLDFKEGYPREIEKMAEKKKMREELVWLNETNANIFIPKIEDSWQGSIPATLVLQHGQYFRQFWEGAIKAESVENVVEKQLTYFNR